MTILDNHRVRISHPVMEKEFISRLLNGSVRSACTQRSLDQSSIVVFLHLKVLSARAKNVHAEYVQVLGPDAIAYLTVTQRIWNDVILQNEPETEDRGSSGRSRLIDDRQCNSGGT
jgi:hypothetical protein